MTYKGDNCEQHTVIIYIIAGKLRKIPVVRNFIVAHPLGKTFRLSFSVLSYRQVKAADDTQR